MKAGNPPLLTILRNPVFHSIFKSYMKDHKAWNLFGAWVQCERFRICCLQKCKLLHKRKGQKPCTAQDQWIFARAMIDNTVPAIRRLVVIDSSYLADLRAQIQTQLNKCRLSIALKADEPTPELEFPTGDFFKRIQDDLYKAMEEGPFQDFIAGLHYYSLIGCTIGR